MLSYITGNKNLQRRYCEESEIPSLGSVLTLYQSTILFNDCNTAVCMQHVVYFK
jgi:hypothetical protein